jgi:hypothetical protein
MPGPHPPDERRPCTLAGLAGRRAGQRVLVQRDGRRARAAAAVGADLRRCRVAGHRGAGRVRRGQHRRSVAQPAGPSRIPPAHRCRGGHRRGRQRRAPACPRARDGRTDAFPCRCRAGGGVRARVRLVATYFTLGRGMATGVVVGALTLGSGTPNLVRGVGGAHWQVTIVVTSARRPDQAFYRVRGSGFLTRPRAGGQDRQPAVNRYRAIRTLAVARLNQALACYRTPSPWQACHRNGSPGAR